MGKTLAFMIAAAVFSSMLTGCASIVSGTTQIVSVEAKFKGESVVGANCKLENEKGTFLVTTPGTVTIHKAYSDLLVTCAKADVPEGLARVKSSTKAMAYGNILFGGIIGVGVDASTGAAYDYPQLISILMGEDIHLPLQETAPVTVPATVPTAQVPAQASNSVTK